MIRPGVGELLEGVAASLEDGVIPGLAPATSARNQVRAAIAILRRVASVWDQVVPTLAEDSRDIEDTLRRVASLLGPAGVVSPGFLESLGGQADAGDGSYATESRRNEALQELLVELQGLLGEREVEEGVSTARAELAALTRRMIARDRLLAQRRPT